MNVINETLKLENQLCFPLYAASREFIKQYRPHLDELGLTYTQYITLTIFREEKKLSVKALGKRLYLDSGTLTPVLKSLEAKGYVHRTRSKMDERVLEVSVTEEGQALLKKAEAVPALVTKKLDLTEEERSLLHDLLYRLLDTMSDN